MVRIWDDGQKVRQRPCRIVLRELQEVASPLGVLEAPKAASSPYLQFLSSPDLGIYTERNEKAAITVQAKGRH
jgi:hypothetical protein